MVIRLWASIPAAGLDRTRAPIYPAGPAVLPVDRLLLLVTFEVLCSALKRGIATF